MDWLKKAGQAIVKFAALTPYGKFFTSVIPGDKDDRILAKIKDSLDDVAAIIVNMEAVGAALNLTGPDKLKGSIPAIGQIILHSSIMAGKPPKDVALYGEGIQDLANAMVKILKSKED